jgi:flagellar hook-associated protein 1 FlgK
MSITSALSNALSGLTAASRGVEVVSTNVANAQSPGFGVRELEIAPQTLDGYGAGVRVIGVQRLVDMGILGDLRLADAAVAGSNERHTFFSTLDELVGASGGENALSDGIARLQAALVEAASHPESTSRLGAVLDAAKSCAALLNTASDRIQQARMEADREIASVVSQLNEDLQHVVDFNVQIRTILASGRDAGGLIDQRQVLIDRISQVIPVREIPREFGMVSLWAAGGAALVEGSAAEFGYSDVGFIAPDMTLASGALSGLTLNDQDLSPSGSQIAGGRLAALFDVRDGLAEAAQATLDAVARDLVERFANPSVDPTLAATDPDLFTDSGTAFVVANEVGLAGRFAVHATVDPDRGGALWHLRAGLGAATAGEPGDSTLLRAMADALATARAPASGPFAGVPHSAGGLAGEASASWSAEMIGQERQLAYHESRSDTLRTLHLQDGVDTDQQMQRLMVLEQSYAANARVIATVDELIQMLLGL